MAVKGKKDEEEGRGAGKQASKQADGAQGQRGERGEDRRCQVCGVADELKKKGKGSRSGRSKGVMFQREGKGRRKRK